MKANSDQEIVLTRPSVAWGDRELLGNYEGTKGVETLYIFDSQIPQVVTREDRVRLPEAPLHDGRDGAVPMKGHCGSQGSYLVGVRSFRVR